MEVGVWVRRMHDLSRFLSQPNLTFVAVLGPPLHAQ